MVNIKHNLEIFAVAIFTGLFLWYSASNILGNQITHPYPVGFFASDAFQNYGISEGIKQQGNYKYQPFAVAGGFHDVVGTHYPILYHLTVLISNFTGIETYDALLLVSIISLLSVSLVVYLLISKFDKKSAILALPLMMLVSYGKFSTSITFGQHGAIIGSLFMVALLWSLSKFGMDEIIFIILFLSSAELGHALGFVFGGIFFAIYLITIFLSGKFKVSYIKKLIIIGILTLTITSYYFIILKGTWIASGYSKLEIVSVQKFLEGRAFPAVLLKDFPILILIPALAGLFVIAISLSKNNNIAVKIALLFLALIPLSNYIGTGHRAFQLRFLWPIFLSALVGIGIYFVMKLLLRKVATIYPFMLFLVLSATLVYAYPVKSQPSSMLHPYQWDSFLWIQKNVPKDDTVYFFYQDITTQHSLYYASSQRRSYVIDVEDFLGGLRNKKVKSSYMMTVSAEGGTGLPYRKSLFSFGSYMQDYPEKMTNYFDICNMTYIVYDKLSSQQVLAEYNILIANLLKDNNWIQEVYSNPLVSILKNNKPGEKCIDEQQLN